MTTRTKLNVAVAGCSVCSLLVTFQKPLGIPAAVLWVVLFPVWYFQIYLIFRCIKILKAEKTREIESGKVPPDETAAARKKTRQRLIMLWFCTLVVSLASPLWLPLTGSSLGRRGDFVIGLVTIAICCAIFGIQLKKLNNRR